MPNAEVVGALRSIASARRHSAAGWPIPGKTSAQAPQPNATNPPNKYNRRTSITSASPAAAMPTRKKALEETKKALATRPRTSALVLRCTSNRRAIAYGAFIKPDSICTAIASVTEWSCE